MRVYIAGTFGRRKELAVYAEEMREVEVEVYADWLDDKLRADSKKMDDVERLKQALRDCNQIADADWVVVFTEKSVGVRRPMTPGFGGHHFEMGLAFGLGKAITVIGPTPNLFAYLPNVERIATWEEFKQTRGWWPKAE